MITSLQLHQNVLGYDYAIIRVYRDSTYRDYQYDSRRWAQLLRSAKGTKDRDIWLSFIRPNGIDHYRIGYAPNILLTRYARETSLQDRITHLHEGRISADSYEAIALLGKLIMYARFGYAVNPFWMDSVMSLVWHYHAVKLLMLGANPCNPRLWRF